ncbi:MAG: nitrite/sulfite reductase [Deltaproteobacteria bacterium]|nr:MAG: nitrite/sulfite reductase [Deltaproteobacteria bacterium]
MRPTREQHLSALAGHQSRTDRFIRGELKAEEWRPIRLSYGLYYQLDHTSHMQRIKIPGGLLSADQLACLADVADRYGRGIAHVTTRQDIQIHWVPVEGIIEMYEHLLGAGITTRGACADSVRNVTACPFAGTAPTEPFDVSPYCIAIHEYFLFNPLNLTLPRKFKIAVEGCVNDCAQAPVNDIGLYAKVRDGARGFSLHAGGGLGAQPFLAKPIRDFIPDRDLLVWCEAIVRVQHRFGERKNRNKARMKYLVQKMGLERFRAAVETEVEHVDGERGAELRTQVDEALAAYRPPQAPDTRRVAVTPRADFAHWQRTNTRAQRQPGYRAAVVKLPLGDIGADQMRAVARLAREHGNGTVRTTNDQNMVLPWVPEAALAALHAGLAEHELAGADVATIDDVVSCPGMDYCSLAITRSMGMAERLRAHLQAVPDTANGFVERLGPFAVKISGCPNSCGQHHVGDIGLTGHSVKTEDGTERPFYSILVGGAVGEGRARVGKRLGRFREQDAAAVIAALARFYERERREGESFRAFVDRVGPPRLQAVAEAGLRGEEASPA